MMSKQVAPQYIPLIRKNSVIVYSYKSNQLKLIKPICQLCESEITYKIIFVVPMIHHVLDVLVEQKLRGLRLVLTHFLWIKHCRMLAEFNILNSYHLILIHIFDTRNPAW